MKSFKIFFVPFLFVCLFVRAGALSRDVDGASGTSLAPVIFRVDEEYMRGDAASGAPSVAFASGPSGSPADRAGGHRGGKKFVPSF